MATLAQTLGVDPLRDKVIQDCVTLIDNQVKTKGFLMKGAYGTIKTIKRGFMPEVVGSLPKARHDKVQPHYHPLDWT